MYKTITSFALPFYDMAVEASAALRGKINREIPGVKEKISENDDGRITEITIFNQEGAALMGRPCGTYITFDPPNIPNEGNDDTPVIKILSELIQSILPQTNNGPALICGIGNAAMVADALGEKTISQLLPTRHLFQSKDLTEHDGFIPTALFCPNVLGNTGMEAAEIIHSVCKQIKPRFVLAVDALATTSSSRLGCSFQLNNTGLTPGGGINNIRPTLNEAALGTPVIAIGVPTVIYPLAFISEAAAILKQELDPTISSSGKIEKILLQKMQPQLSQDAMTPKDIDNKTERLSHILGGAIQCALHPAINESNYSYYLP